MTQHGQDLFHIDASTFQKPLQQLAEVLSQKVKREAPKLLAAPGFVAFDLHVLMRQAQHTYDLLFTSTPMNAARPTVIGDRPIPSSPYR